MSKLRTHKDVFALQFPNGGGEIAGSRAVTSATEQRVGAVAVGESLNEEQALAMLGKVPGAPSEWSVHEYADYWLIRFRVAAPKS